MNGEVVVEVIVDETGKVISAKPISGPAVLRRAAVNAALGRIYTPTRTDAVATEAVGTITSGSSGLLVTERGRSERAPVMQMEADHSSFAMAP
jgi:hypothetical protein